MPARSFRIDAVDSKTSAFALRRAKGPGLAARIGVSSQGMLVPYDDTPSEPA